MKQKGRTPPPAAVDHAAALRERLGKAAYEAIFEQEVIPLAWTELAPEHREHYRKIGQAVMRALVKRDPRMGEISAEGIVSAQNGRPYVQLAIDISPTQVTPGKARELAMMLFEAADSAESDAVLMAFARNEIGLDAAGATQLLHQFRQMREQQRGTEVSSA